LQKAVSVLRAARPNFLLLSLVVVALGMAVAFYEGHTVAIDTAMLIAAGAVIAHMAVNLLNEYQDFDSGLDEMTRKTPFSGGSGALIENPLAAKAVLGLFFVCLISLIGIGVYLIMQTGWGLLLFGLIGLGLIVFYTKTITRLPWLCLIAPGVAFGPLMVMGSYYALTAELSLLVSLISLIPFFLVNNLLLLNQIPDLEADKKVGRYNILMHLGTENGLQIFAAFVWLSYLMLVVIIWWFELPSWLYIGFLPLLIAFPMLRQLQDVYLETDKLIPVLAMNVIINLLTPMLIAMGFFIA